jgi:hypothetical protein
LLGCVNSLGSASALIKGDVAEEIRKLKQHAERTAADRGYALFGLDVPAVDRAAVTYLQARGHRIDSFFTLYLSDEPRGAFDRYSCTTPTFFI